ncbi:hypothetical protein PIB30_081391, partial [Stylosanthes scabra]|nr:hypothetical protein [Stylosanthes scabra]
PARDQQEGRLLRWRARLDRVSVEQFRWTPYDSPEMQALIPDWMRAQPEVHTWRSAVPVVCFNFVHMHHIDRVIRQYGGEQPVPRLPVDVTRYMASIGRGADRSEITRTPSFLITCCRRLLRKKDHDSVDSDSTRAKAAGNMLLFPSCTTAIRSTPPYRPYKWVPSTDTNGLQCLTPSMQEGKLQKTLSNWQLSWSNLSPS